MRNGFRAAVAVITLLIPTVAGCRLPPTLDTGRTVTITLVRHGQSEGNFSGTIDTSIPGPDLTELGKAQARSAANSLMSADCDGVFASSMVRTQETAQPLADQVGMPIVVLPGLREIEAGQAEGKREDAGASVYYQVIMAWAAGHREQRIPGSIDGNEFDARFDEAIDTIYRSGDAHPVAFSHGAAIAAWTMMHAKNAHPDLMTKHPLPNTGIVVIVGNPKGGWMLKEWTGTTVS